jgi:ferritin-like metal-binding protein YciE
MAEIGNPKKLFEHELGMALGAERKVLSTLKKLERSAQRDELKQQFHHHHEETEGQIENLEQAMQAVGAEGGHESDSANGIAAEGEKLIEKVDEELIDAVLLAAAAKTEHVEIAMYEGLITKAEAMGADDIVALLQANPRPGAAHPRRGQTGRRKTVERTRSPNGLTLAASEPASRPSPIQKRTMWPVCCSGPASATRRGHC